MMAQQKYETLMMPVYEARFTADMLKFLQVQVQSYAQATMIHSGCLCLAESTTTGVLS